MIDTDTLQKKIGYVFQDQNLLLASLTHSSIRFKGKDFERLEFLGDRVLELVVSEILYQYFPKEREGDLARRLAALVCREACEKVSQLLELSNYVIAIGADLGPRTGILSDAVESLLGAMYLDGGLPPCHKFIEKYWEGLRDESLRPPKDPKTALQEWAQSHTKTIPLYELLSSTGPDHSPTFEVKVSVLESSTQGKGPSKRHAEQEAAQKFLEIIKHG
jgi:ribonuclease-3